ncbi:(Fe-S)-binding protein [Nitratifractor sp.]
MRVALFVPCYVDQFYPEAAMATLEVLQAHGCTVEYPRGQTCCGQPFFNNGLLDEAYELAERFVALFEGYDAIVAPSSSCVATVRHRYGTLSDAERFAHICSHTYELCEFLHDVIGPERLRFERPFPLRVGLHNSCHAIRELHEARSSEEMTDPFDKIAAVLAKVPDIEVVPPGRDECCGFGGSFSVMEPEVSAAMGLDRIADHRSNGVDLIAGADRSCLMHMEGLARKRGIPIGFAHVAEILAGRIDPKECKK